MIAEALAPKCKAMGMTVVGITSSPRQVAGFDRVHAMSASCWRCCRSLDYLVLLTPYSPATHHMIDAKVFAAMKPTSYFVNVARGGVVDEDALVAALRDKKIAGAALDVFNQEPLPAGPSALGLSRMSSSPRTRAASATPMSISPCRSSSTTCAASSTGDLKGMMNVARAAA